MAQVRKLQPGGKINIEGIEFDSKELANAFKDYYAKATQSNVYGINKDKQYERADEEANQIIGMLEAGQKPVSGAYTTKPGVSGGIFQGITKNNADEYGTTAWDSFLKETLALNKQQKTTAPTQSTETWFADPAKYLTKSQYGDSPEGFEIGWGNLKDETKKLDLVKNSYIKQLESLKGSDLSIIKGLNKEIVDEDKLNAEITALTNATTKEDVINIGNKYGHTEVLYSLFEDAAIDPKAQADKAAAAKAAAIQNDPLQLGNPNLIYDDVMTQRLISEGRSDVTAYKNNTTGKYFLVNQEKKAVADPFLFKNSGDDFYLKALVYDGDGMTLGDQTTLNTRSTGAIAGKLYSDALKAASAKLITVDLTSSYSPFLGNTAQKSERIIMPGVRILDQYTQPVTANPFAPYTTETKLKYNDLTNQYTELPNSEYKLISPTKGTNLQELDKDLFLVNTKTKNTVKVVEIKEIGGKQVAITKDGQSISLGNKNYYENPDAKSFSMFRSSSPNLGDIPAELTTQNQLPNKGRVDSPEKAKQFIDLILDGTTPFSGSSLKNAISSAMYFMKQYPDIWKNMSEEEQKKLEETFSLYYTNPENYSTVLKKDGGILKADLGTLLKQKDFVPIERKPTMATAEAKKVIGGLKGGSHSARIGDIRGQSTKEATWRDNTDVAILGADTLSLAGGFIGVGAGLAATTMQLISDWDNEGVSGGELALNLAINAGFTALSFVPGVGAAKTALKAGKIAKATKEIRSAQNLVKSATKVAELAKKSTNVADIAKAEAFLEKSQIALKGLEAAPDLLKNKSFVAKVEKILSTKAASQAAVGVKAAAVVGGGYAGYSSAKDIINDVQVGGLNAIELNDLRGLIGGAAALKVGKMAVTDKLAKFGMTNTKAFKPVKVKLTSGEEVLITKQHDTAEAAMAEIKAGYNKKALDLEAKAKITTDPIEAQRLTAEADIFKNKQVEFADPTWWDKLSSQFTKTKDSVKTKLGFDEIDGTTRLKDFGANPTWMQRRYTAAARNAGFSEEGFTGENMIPNMYTMSNPYGKRNIAARRSSTEITAQNSSIKTKNTEVKKMRKELATELINQRNAAKIVVTNKDGGILKAELGIKTPLKLHKGLNKFQLAEIGYRPNYSSQSSDEKMFATQGFLNVMEESPVNIVTPTETVSTNPVKTEPKKNPVINYAKYPDSFGQSNKSIPKGLDLRTLYTGIGLLNNLRGNEKGRQELAKNKALLLQMPTEVHKQVLGDLTTRRMYQQAGANTLNQAKRIASGTSDFNKSAAVMLEGVGKSNELNLQGKLADAVEYRRTSADSLLSKEKYSGARNATANQNLQSINQNNNEINLVNAQAAINAMTSKDAAIKSIGMIHAENKASQFANERQVSANNLLEKYKTSKSADLTEKYNTLVNDPTSSDEYLDWKAQKDAVTNTSAWEVSTQRKALQNRLKEMATVLTAQKDIDIKEYETGMKGLASYSNPYSLNFNFPMRKRLTFKQGV